MGTIFRKHPGNESQEKSRDSLPQCPLLGMNPKKNPGIHSQQRALWESGRAESWDIWESTSRNLREIRESWETPPKSSNSRRDFGESSNSQHRASWESGLAKSWDSFPSFFRKFIPSIGHLGNEFQDGFLNLFFHFHCENWLR